MPDGSRRYRGLAEGGLVTVLGQKAAAGGVLPEQIFAGDRVAFEESQRQSASAILNMGICAIILAPPVRTGRTRQDARRMKVRRVLQGAAARTLSRIVHDAEA